MAALWRNRICALTAIQANQDINLQGLEEADIIAVHRSGGMSAVQIFLYPGRGEFRKHSLFPVKEDSAEDGDVIAAFISQFYDERALPKWFWSARCQMSTNCWPKPCPCLLVTRLSRAARNAGPGASWWRWVPARRRGAVAQIGRHQQPCAAAGRWPICSGWTACRNVLRFAIIRIFKAHAVGGMVVAGPDGL